VSGKDRLAPPSTTAKSAAYVPKFRAFRRPALRKVQTDESAPLGRCRWRGNLPIPKHSHWAVRRLVLRLNDEQTTMTEACARAGIARTSIWNWANSYHPRIDEIEAALNAVGLALQVVEMDE
jgi:hypothetical protein